jgi:predicted TIM-barrel fold metal-dependent hydrolase
MLNNVPVIDADSHLMDVPELIRKYLPKRFQFRIGPFYPQKKWVRTLGDTLGKHWVRDVSVRLADMDVQGIDVSILYPTLALFIGRVRRPKLAMALSRAYNDLAHSYCMQSPRLKAVATLQLHNVSEAVKELRRAVTELNFVGVTLPADGCGKNLGNAEFHPIYAEAERLGVPVAIHASTGDADTAFDKFIAAHTIGHPFPQMRQLTGMIFGGIPELFPKLRLMYLEAGAGWVPYWMERMDHEYKLRAVEAPLCKTKPSDYIRSGRIFFSCEAEESLLPVVVDKIGEDTLLYASDYPHWDMDFPDSAKELWERNDLSERTRRKILGENAKQVYGLG